MLLLLVVVESRLEEFHEFVDIFVVGVGVVEGLALVVDEDVEGLCVGAELAALQVAPLVAHGAECGGLSAFLHLDGLGEGGFFVDVEGDEHIVLHEEVAHLGVVPHGEFHFTAVHAAMAGKVDHYGFAHALSISHAGFVVAEFGLNLDGVEVEVLRGNGRGEGADGLDRCAPQAGHHVDGKGERGQGQEEAGHRGVVLVLVVVGELDAAQQVDAEQGEEHYPEGEEGFAVEQMPTVGEVGHREELEGEGQFEEAQHHLHHVEPAAALGRTLEPRGEEGEEGERQGQGYGETEHADGGSKRRTAARADLNKQEADDGTRAREADERQCERHEEDTQQTCGFLGLVVDSIAPLRGKRDFKTAKEAGGKHHEHEEEEDVEDGVGGEVVERVGAEQGGDDKAQRHVDDNDAHAVGDGVANALGTVAGSLEEEADRHGDDGPHARGEEGYEAAHKAEEEDVPPSLAGHVACVAAEAAEFVDDGCPERFGSRTVDGHHGQCGGGGSVGGSGCLRLCGRSLGSGGCLGLCGGCGSLCGGTVGALQLAVNRGGGQAVLVVAGAEFQVALQFVFLLGQFDTLGEGGLIFEEGDGHFEDGVLHGLGARPGLEAALETCALDAVDAEGGRRRTALADVGGVDVPACVGLAVKHDVDRGSIHALVLNAEVDLSLHCRHNGEQQHERTE